MKKFTLMLLGIALCSTVFSQGSKPSIPLRVPDRKLSVDLSNNNLLQFSNKPHAPHIAGNSGGLRDVTYVQIGSAGSGLTVLNNAANVVSAYNSLNTVSFTHRNNSGVFGGTSAQYRFDVSTDGGQTFVSNIGPLNPNTPNAGEGSINGRYPQGSLFNPSGVNIADSLYDGYVGTWHNGDPSGAANTWEGIIHGVGRVDGVASTFTEGDDSVNHGNVNVFVSLVQSTPGVFWTITEEYDANDISSILNDSNYVLLKGVWNNVTRDIDWNIAQIINVPPEGDTTFAIDPLIAFDPSGQNGWIAIDGDYINDGLGVYQPVFLSTTDGGITWSSPTFIDLSQYSSVMNTLDPTGSGIPTTGFDADLAVDMNGNAHFVSVVGSGAAHSIESGLEHHVFDITNVGGTWNAVDLSRVYGFRGATGTDYSEDNRCQAGITPDGKKVVFTWLDTDTLLVDPYDANQYTNSSPNLWGLGFDAISGTYSSPKNLTFNSDFDSRAFDPCLAPVTLRNGADDATVLPIVLLQLNANGTFASPADFFYMQNATINDSEFSVGVATVSKPAIQVTQNYPNPFTDNTQINVTLDKAAAVNLKITDILGQVISEKNFNFGSGSHSITLSRGEMGTGVYHFTVTVGSELISRTMIIE